MTHYGSFSDDHYVNMHLNTEMDLPSSRETVLHFFEQLQKLYPSMRNFYSRERGEYVLEEDKDQGQYRWTSIEPRRVCSGFVNPGQHDNPTEQHLKILDMVPYCLSASPLDCESLNLMYGFDYTYRGNQNEIVAQALGLPPAFDKLREMSGTSLLCQEPSIQFALDEECRTQCRLTVETRTTAYHVRNNDYPEDQLSVYLTARRYGSLDAGETYTAAYEALAKICEDLINDYLIEHVLLPLQQTIAIK